MTWSEEFKLGLGEAEAIALARAAGARLVVMEDRSGVNACRVLRLPFTGVLGILMRMKEKQLLTTEASLRKLKTLERFGRYRPEIVADVQRRLEE